MLSRPWRAIGFSFFVGLTLASRASAQCPCLGDMNGNAAVNQGDVALFVAALLNSTYDACADVSQDGLDNGRDVRPFVVRVIAQTSCTGACCLAGGACSVLSQTACVQQSGVYQGNGTLCSPNPCPQIGACCITGNCIFLSGPNCAAQGGTFQGVGTLCSPNPCPQVGACCITGNCTVLTATVCGAQSGSYQGNGTVCSPNPCPQIGACCVAGNCIPTSQPACNDQNGTYQGDGTLCTPNPCPQTGACCISTGCVIADMMDCMLQGGVFQAIGSTCTPNPCPATGACCIGSVCGTFTQAACTQFGGTYHGDNSPCTPDPCLIPGACCTQSGECSVIGALACANAGGVYRGDNTLCLPNPCTGACCLPTGCEIRDALTCTTLGGTFQGLDTVCNPDPCPLCVALPAPPDTLANGPHGVGRIADINLPNMVVGGGGPGTFPEIPDVILERDGSQTSAAFAATGKDAVAGFDVRGQVRYPAVGAGGLDAAVAAGGPFPLIVIAHGNHNRFNPLVGNPSDENYRGYTYLQDFLATRGYISVSLDEDDFTDLDPGILARAWLVLCHTENMRRINAQAGHVLQGAIDMNRIAYMGHSRGGEAVVKAMQMNATVGGADGGPAFGAAGADIVFGLKAVWGLASTRFFDGAFNFDQVAPQQAVVPASNIVGGLELIPFMGMWGSADGDISGANIVNGAGAVLIRNFHVQGTYDGSDPDPKQFVWIEGANHNYWNSSWFGIGFGDDGLFLIPPAGRVSHTQQQDLARGYGLAFFESYVRDQQPFQVFFKRPANERPAAPIAATRVHLQYQPRPPQRSVVDDFETNPAVGTTSRGTAGVNTATLVGPDELRLDGGDQAAAVTLSFFHNTRGVLFEWNNMADFYETVVTDANVAGFENLSFRAALDRRGPGETPALDLRVILRDNMLRTAAIQTATITSIPVAQVRNDDVKLSKSMLKTIRIPLCRFKDVTPNLDLTNITHIRFEFDRAAGKMALDDIEFSN